LIRSLRIIVVLAFVAVAMLAASASAGAAGSGVYPAKLSASGSLTITTIHDFTGPCERNQGWTIEAKADVNVSSKIQLEWITHGGIVQGTEAKTPGGAKNRNVMSGYFETNLCPPDEPIPFEESDKPQCSGHTGAGIADISGSKGKIVIGLGRKGGGEQDSSCQGGFVIGPKPTGATIGTLQSDFDSIVLPLGVGVGPFKSLRVGKKISRKIKVSGPCAQGTKATTSVFRDDVCTVKGSFDVTVQRLPGKGGSGFTTAGAFSTLSAW
jgi:hypothetical protein